MSEETEVAIPVEPVVELPRPDIAAPEKKRRGRKPMPRDAQGNIIRDPAEQAAVKLKQELGKRLPGGEVMTDANVGKAISGALAAIGIFRGPHWRAFPQEERELGETFGPLARMYGPTELAKWITLLMAVPVVTSIVMPRVAVEQQIMTGGLPKEKGRVMLLQLKALMESEKTLNVEAGVRDALKLDQALNDAAKMQQGIIKQAADFAQQQHNEAIKAEEADAPEEASNAA